MKKKMVLMSLFLVTCAAFAMDVPEQTLKDLPSELNTVVTRLKKAKTFQEAIDIIKTSAQANLVFEKTLKTHLNPLIEFVAQKFSVPTDAIHAKLGALSEKWLGKPLIENAKKNNIEEVKKLLEENADPNAQDEEGNTALIAIAPYKGVELVKLLLEKGADPNIQNDAGQTILMIAARAGNKEVVEELLNNEKINLDLSLKNNRGKTALMLAAFYGYKDIVALLLQQGADPNIKDTNGKTALDFAKEKDHTEIVKILEEAIAKQQKQ